MSKINYEFWDTSTVFYNMSKEQDHCRAGLDFALKFLVFMHNFSFSECVIFRARDLILFNSTSPITLI